jgi:hypothetical protein
LSPLWAAQGEELPKHIQREFDDYPRPPGTRLTERVG